METQEVLQQILDKVSNLEAGQQRLESDIRSLESGQRNLELGQQKLELGQQKMQKDMDRMGVKVKNIDNTIRYIFDDIYRLEKRFEKNN